MTPDLTGGSRRRGRPRTAGDAHCDRCGRSAGKLRTRWPEGGICGTCFHTAVRTTGTCPRCNHHGMLPGLDGDQPICRHCAEIPTDLDCHRCGTEAEHYRRGGICARCALRDDLTALLAPGDARVQPKLRELVEVLCAVDRPESIHTWKRRPAVQTLLAGLGDGTVELTHDALDSADSGGKTAEHLRDLLLHHGLLPGRDRDLARFQTWLVTRIETTEPAWARRILERYGRWHHVRAIRRQLAEGRNAQARVHLAKQEITEIGRLLAWLHENDTTLADCTQAHLDRWITTGPSTRSFVRPFLAWARRHRLAPTGVELARRHARTTPTVTDEQRFDWLRRCLIGEADTLAYRVAGVLLLLYAQPLVRVAALRRDQIVATPAGPALLLGDEPVAIPHPFAELLEQHLGNLPHSRTTNTENSWFFPGVRAGQHLHPNTIAIRLRTLGIDLRGSRNSALRDMVERAPAPIVASQLGYADVTMERHAERAAQPDERYAALLPSAPSWGMTVGPRR